MKEQLINLLYEQYKQQMLIEKFEELGVDMNALTVNNRDAVLTIIGFPKDNTIDYDFGDGNGKQIDDNLFCRDWLDVPFDKITGTETTDVKQQLSQYVEWLYEELTKLTKPKS